jgi:hypothetical protein
MPASLCASENLNRKTIRKGEFEQTYEALFFLVHTDERQRKPDFWTDI